MRLDHSLDLDLLDWTEWMDRALHGDFQVLVREREEETSEALTRIFKLLPEKYREDFRRALIENLQSTPVLESNAERLFDLAQICQVAKPVGGRKLLANLLTSRAGNFRFVVGEASRQLQAALLTAVAKYVVDVWLVQYIVRSAKDFPGVSYALLSFRLLSFSMDDACYRYHSILVPRLESDSDFDKYEGQLESALDRTQGFVFYRWFQTAVFLLNDLPSVKVERWHASVRRVLAGRSEDPYARLAELLIRPDDWRPRAEDVVKIAELSYTADRATVIKELARVQREKGWAFYSPESPIARGLKLNYLIRCGSTVYPLREDSPLIEIFYGVNAAMDEWAGQKDDGVLYED